MEISTARPGDWRVFLGLAGREGWRVPPRESELFAGPLADKVFVLRREQPCGFVTVVPHEKSGWIGNLIVPSEMRGRGYGALLFDHALEVLAAHGVTSVWLTASPLGRPIYEKRGFRAVDKVVRWTLSPPGAERSAPPSSAPPERLWAGDVSVWGESRRALLEPLAEGGKVFAFGGTVALLQRGPGMQVLGPWLSAELCPRENRQMVTAALEAAEQEAELVADVLESSPVQPLLAAAGFRLTGRTDLMVRGPLAAGLRGLVALASLGSMG